MKDHPTTWVLYRKNKNVLIFSRQCAKTSIEAEGAKL
jgi:hypothetical protein